MEYEPHNWARGYSQHSCHDIRSRDVQMRLRGRAPDKTVIALEAFESGVINRCAYVGRGPCGPRIASRRRFLVRLTRSKQAMDSVIKCFEASLHRWIVVEKTTGVVVQERRCRPETNQARRPIITAAVTWSVPFEALLSKRIPRGNLPNGRQVLVGLGREVFPHVVLNAIARHRARCVRLYDCDRDTDLRGEEIIF